MSAILSIQQPWAWAIVNGWKRVENRTWGTRYRGPLVIHAGKRVLRDDIDFVVRTVAHQTGINIETLRQRYATEAVAGCIVGTCQLTGCRPGNHMDSNQPPEITHWAFGPWCFLLDNANPLAKPLEWRGRLGIWHEDVPLVDA